jgi:hypothetical protein
MKAGDWICQKPECKAHNFAKRDTCFQCGQRSSSLESSSSNQTLIAQQQNHQRNKDVPMKDIFLDYGQSFFSGNPFSSYGFGYQS